MHATLPLLSETDFPAIRRGPLQTLQVNLGYKCNQSCLHCHVNAGPTRREMMDNATLQTVVAFLQASGVVLWLYAAAALAPLAARSRLAVAALLIVLALPASVEFVVRKAIQPGEAIAPAAVEAMAALRAASRPGDVVITRPLPRLVPLPMVLAGRRVAFSNYLSYWQQFVSPDALAERDRQVRAFFRARTPSEALAVAGALQGRYLYLTGRQKVDFETASVLEPLFERDGERVYRIALSARGGSRRERQPPE